MKRSIASEIAKSANERNELNENIKELGHQNRQVTADFQAVSTENDQLKIKVANLESDNKKLMVLNPRVDVWCSCNRRAFGKMIACDNQHCQIKWFHLQCVSLKVAPKGKWFCPKCS